MWCDDFLAFFIEAGSSEGSGACELRSSVVPVNQVNRQRDHGRYIYTFLLV